MVVAVSGHRDVVGGAVEQLQCAVIAVIDSGAEELRLGGALGTDHIALLEAHRHGGVRIVVVVPATTKAIPAGTRDAVLECADEVVEMGLDPRAPWSYLRRNDRLLDGAEVLLALYDGRRTGGTAYTVREARKRGIQVRVLDPRLSANP